MIKAVLFDLDGLLVDTETMGIKVAFKICKNLGIKLTKAEQQSFVGITDEKFYRQLLKKRKKKYNINNILDQHFILYEQLLQSNLKAFPGASLPKQVKAQGYKIGLVSGSTAKQIAIILSQLDLKEQFDVIVSVDDIIHSKPHPESYLIAAYKLNVHPTECIVLEDATAGIQAAKKAGMQTVGVINNGGQDLSLADRIVPNLSVLSKLPTKR